MPSDPEEISASVFAALAVANRRARRWPSTAPVRHGPLGPVVHDPKGIAKHLTLLSDAGLVSSDAGAGRRVLYRHRSEPIKVAQSYLAALAADWDGTLDRLSAYLLVADPQN